MARRIGVVGGTGFETWGAGGESLTLETEHGPVVVEHHRARGDDVFFVPRHGPGHERPPHRVDHRANVRALQACRPDAVVGVFNVGAVDPTLHEGAWVVPDDFVQADGAVPTFFNDVAVHVDVAEPYCPPLRRALLAGAPRGAREGGVYASVAGPRFETRAEARALVAQEVAVVGMTGGPEATLMREARLHYAALAYVANASGAPAASARTIMARLAREGTTLRRWLPRAAAAFPARPRCRCVERGAMEPLGPAVRP